MRSPRILRISSSSSATRSRPPKRMCPPATRPLAGGTSPMMDKAVTLLPQPDSPTIASVSLCWTAKLTSRTAGCQPPPVRNTVTRFSTARIGASAVVITPRPPRSSFAAPQLRIDGVAQPVAEHIEREDDEQDGEAGKDQKRPPVEDVL